MNPNDPSDLARKIADRIENPVFSKRKPFTPPILTPEQEVMIERYEALDEKKHLTNADCEESYDLLQQIATFQPQWHARTLDSDGREINVFSMHPEGEYLLLTFEEGRWWKWERWPYFSGW